jgi:hypothetical protein
MNGRRVARGAGEFSDYRKVPREEFKEALEKMRPQKRKIAERPESTRLLKAQQNEDFAFSPRQMYVLVPLVVHVA